MLWSSPTTSRSSHTITALLHKVPTQALPSHFQDFSYQLSLKINITMAARPDPGWSRFQCPNFVNCGQLVRVAHSYCSQCTVCLPFSLFSSTALNRGWSDADYLTLRHGDSNVTRMMFTLALPLRLQASECHWLSVVYLPAFQHSPP